MWFHRNKQLEQQQQAKDLNQQLVANGLQNESSWHER
jgi:hypothetical protein